MSPSGGSRGDPAPYEARTVTVGTLRALTDSANEWHAKYLAARAEAFEECARIADAIAIRHRGTREVRTDLAGEAERIAAEIRRRAKP